MKKIEKKAASESKDELINRILGESCSVDAKIKRLKKVCGATSDIQLAKVLNINRQNIGAARRRETIPLNWIIDIGKEYNISLDWLLYGDEQTDEKFFAKVSESTKNFLHKSNNTPFIDTNLLEGILVKIEECLEHLDAKLSSIYRAELITTLYEICMDQNIRKPDYTTTKSLLKVLIDREKKDLLKDKDRKNNIFLI